VLHNYDKVDYRVPQTVKSSSRIASWFWDLVSHEGRGDRTGIIQKSIVQDFS
jgi:hypothetical protein